MDRSAEFPGIEKSTYLNSCSHGLLPRRTRAALERHLDAWEALPDWDTWVAAADAARRTFAGLIGARPEDIALSFTASTATAAVASALPERAGASIVTTDLDFPASPFVAERQRARGFEHVHIRTSPEPMRADEWAKHLKGDVALACIPAVASFTGYRLDVKAFAAEAHARGAPILIDAFQGAGTYPIDVKRDDVDFLVTGVYKWLLGPVGLAFLYVKPEHHALVPTTSGWYALDKPYDFDPFGDMAADARRYQAGAGSVLGYVAAVESFNLLQEVGIGAIERHNRDLVERIMERCRDRKWEVLTPDAPADRASIVTFRVPHLERALAACKRENVILGSRLGGIRVAPHLYTRETDIDRLFAVLDKA